MPRPTKCRNISYTPDFYFFKPAGIPRRFLDEVSLTIDECEAIRLADLEGLYQEQAAEKMGVSRQTFGNIIESARKKIADSIINGKSLKITGGSIDMLALNERNFKCASCAHTWSVPYGTTRPFECPSCNSENIRRDEKDKGHNFSKRGASCRLNRGKNHDR